tara:strand:+ start:4901 stop:5125 length:225 start_codon:yes stop_codon:yes gene_type:complete
VTVYRKFIAISNIFLLAAPTAGFGAGEDSAQSTGSDFSAAPAASLDARLIASLDAVAVRWALTLRGHLPIVALS